MLRTHSHTERKSRLARFRPALLSSVVALAAAIPVAASAAPAGYSALPQSVLSFAPDVHVLGDAAPASHVTFAIAVRPRNMDALSARIDAGSHVSPAELSSTFLPKEADYRKVTAWIRAQGLTVDREYPTRLMIAVSGTAADVGRVLGVHFSRVSVDGEAYIATTDTPSLPASLAPLVTSINGLQPHLHLHTNHIRRPVVATPFAGYTPLGVLDAYGASKLTQTGSGVTTAIIIDTVPNASDLTTFWSDFGIKQSLSNITYENVTQASSLPAPSGEETIDVEMSSSMAPSSHVRIYATATLAFTAVDNGYEAIVLDYLTGFPSQQVSISLGACESGVSAGQRLTDVYYHAMLASLGSSVLVASGDSGSQECGSGNGNVASFDSTSPYVTAVGGTHLIETSKGVVTSETAWTGSGGGLSLYYATPSYQSSLKLASRGVPDVAAVGDPATGVAIYIDGGFTVYGGTSVATPIWAGLMALVNQARIADGKSTLGELNPLLYPLLKTKNFRDIKSGCNGGYCAKVGYDLVTGLGTPLMSNLLPTLTALN
jgi:kumamolisin